MDANITSPAVPNNQGLRFFLSFQHVAFKHEIDSMDDIRLQNTPVGDLRDCFVKKYTAHAPEIDESGIRIEYGDADVIVNATFYDDNFIWNRPMKETGTRIVCYVPFTGDRQFFQFTPSAREFRRPLANVGNNELEFVYDRLAADFEDIRSELTGDIKNLKQYLTWIAGETERFNSSIREDACQGIRARREKLHHDRQLAEELGFPTRHAPHAVATDMSPTGTPNVLIEPLAVSMEQQQTECTSDAKRLEISPCYTSVHWAGQDFRLTPTQAAAFKLLCEYSLSQVPEVHQQSLLVEIESKAKRLAEVFRSNRPARQALIVRGERKGTVRLNPVIGSALALRRHSSSRNDA